MGSDNLITLEEAKAQLIVDHDMDNSLIQGYIAAAIEVAQNHIGKPFGDDGIPFTQSIKIGCLMYVAHLYANREVTTDTPLSMVPMAISALWNVYREPGIY